MTPRPGLTQCQLAWCQGEADPTPLGQSPRSTRPTAAGQTRDPEQQDREEPRCQERADPRARGARPALGLGRPPTCAGLSCCGNHSRGVRRDFPLNPALEMDGMFHRCLPAARVPQHTLGERVRAVPSSVRPGRGPRRRVRLAGPAGEPSLQGGGRVPRVSDFRTLAQLRLLSISPPRPTPQ